MPGTELFEIFNGEEQVQGASIAVVYDAYFFLLKASPFRAGRRSVLRLADSFLVPHEGD
ncbi:hypothetical protein [Thermococcus pacificus]|uniref:hypothetical protein n=1 Tax=Thermococcus pacificus TaxID=71998 RepID=UPI001E2C5169|nr:hypothetical protein [Thermococcus pacificus]